jgi:hypothetical protein
MVRRHLAPHFLPLNAASVSTAGFARVAGEPFYSLFDLSLSDLNGERFAARLDLKPARIAETGGSFHLTALTTFSQPAPAQLTHTGEADAGRFRSMPLPKQWPHFNAGMVTST